MNTYNDFEGRDVTPVLTPYACADGAHATCPRWDYASGRDVAPIDACGCLCHNASHGDRAEYFRTGKLTPRSVARQHVYHAWEDAEHYASLGCASCYRVVGLES